MMHRPSVVIIGAGFGGLFAAKQLVGQPVDVTLIDRNNYHIFTPLLYQVATAGLDPSEIAYPIRTIFRGASNVALRMGEVSEIDAAAKQVHVRSDGTLYHVDYDYLIVAAGTVTHFFNNPQIAQFSFGLKDLSEAVVLRNHILKVYERAAWTDDSAERRASATIVVVGGGPTGLETAGALHELSSNILSKEYALARSGMRPRVMLVEATDRLLQPYPEKLQQAALRQLESLGVEVILGDPVAAVDGETVVLTSGRVIPTHTLIWSAGVTGSPLAESLGVPLVRGGRVPVQPTMAVSGLDDVYVVGDLSYVEDGKGDTYPQMIPVAQQQGILAANNVLRRVQGLPQDTFTFYDRGIMATIGRRRAVAWIYNRIPMTGFLAWVAWLGLHLVWLLGFRNRLSVFISWIYNYFTYDRSVRIILEHKKLLREDPAAEPD